MTRASAHRIGSTGRGRTKRLLLVAMISVVALASVGFVFASPAFSAGGPCGPPVVNPVACENTLPGDPQSDWQV